MEIAPADAHPRQGIPILPRRATSERRMTPTLPPVLTGLARILGLAALRDLIDRLPPRPGAAVTVLLTLVLNAVPWYLVTTQQIGYGEVLVWLWAEILVIAFVTQLRLNRTKKGAFFEFGMASGFARSFFLVHYVGMFTILPVVLGYWLVLPKLPTTTSVWVVAALTLASLGVTLWAQRIPLQQGRPLRFGDILVAYLRLSLAYAALFIPLAAAGISEGDSRPVNLSELARLGGLVCGLKLTLELVLLLVWQWRAGIWGGAERHPDRGRGSRLPA